MLHVFSWLPYLLPTLLAIHFLSNYWHLRHIPGPWYASCTNLYRLFVVWGRNSHDVYLELHRKYGDVVRIGPNCVSVSGPGIKESIYGIQKGFVKSDFYLPLQNMIDGKRVASLVAMTDEAEQSRSRRPVAHAYSLSTMIEYEGLVDSTIALFLSRLDTKYADTGKILDLGLWLQFFAFDVIGELTFSKRLGFLANGSDVENIMQSIGTNFDRISVLGQIPWLDLCLWKNPIYLRFFARAVPSPIISFGQRRLEERLNADLDAELSMVEIADPKLREKDLERSQQTKPDFLTRFLHLRKQHADTISDQQVLAYLFANVNAGSDTTASILRAIFYYLLKNPTSLKRLEEELELATSKEKLSAPFPSWTESQELPYLSAVIKEALRLHPALSLPLERVVPASGLNLELESPRKSLDPISYYFPPGTVVGINPWVFQRDSRIFGTDPTSWNPNRWLHANAKHMENELLTFGAGKRTCLGRNIAMLELHKLVPAVLLRYEMKLADENKEWRLRNSWIVAQEGVDVVINRKQKYPKTG